MEYCGQKKAVKIEKTGEGRYVNFQNHIRSMKVPFVVYADFECFTTKVEPEPAKAGVDGIVQLLERMMKTTLQKVERGSPPIPIPKSCRSTYHRGSATTSSASMRRYTPRSR